jgi:hypothetical protein
MLVNVFGKASPNHGKRKFILLRVEGLISQLTTIPMLLVK